MSKDVILKKGNEHIFPVTKYENILNAPNLEDITVQDIYVGEEEPNTDKLWIDTSDDNLQRVQTQSDIINSIQTAVYTLQQQVSQLMLLRTNGVISGNVTDSTFTEIANSAEPVIPDIIAEDEEYADQIEYPSYAEGSEPTVNHVTIKMGTWSEIQSNKRFFINGELVWCTDRSAMYIYVNGSFKKVASSSSSPDEPIIDDDTMDIAQLQEQLNNLDQISFVPVKDPGRKYTVKVNEYGNLIVYDANNDSAMPEPQNRGLYMPGVIKDLIGELKINSFYLGGLDKDEHSYQPCSHNFVELANISYHDINLNGLCLLYSNNETTWTKLPLWGVCKAQSTFLIRGAQCSVMDVNTTKIKVKTFDMEWIVNGSPIKFDRGNQKVIFYLCWCDLEDNNKIWIMDGDNDLKSEFPTNDVASIFDITNKRCAKGYIELIGAGQNVSFCENTPYGMPDGKQIDENVLFVKRYTIDPVSQSNAKVADGLNKLNNLKYLEHIDLTEVNVKGVEKFTPKASFENKNLSTDKHNFDPDKPNTITCSFGMQATYKDAQHPATRCFNWNSVGYYDEFVWYKKKTDSEWTRVESYKEGLDYVALNRPTDPKCIKEQGKAHYDYYTRLRWETFYGAAITTHKLMITGLEPGVYEYKVGRSDENGNPTDYVSKIREFTIKADSEVTSFDFIQTTDQQGANWDEYQIWDLSADFINRNERYLYDGQRVTPRTLEANPQQNERDFEFTINTGDITYNGSRPNEWIDYYAGYSYLDDKEEMFTIGNNDLAPIPADLNESNNPKYYGMTILGYGRERPDKISHFVADLFYTQEMNVDNPPIFEGESIDSNALKQFRIPSLYSFNYGQFHFVSLNSEIRTGYVDWETLPTTVTGEFGVKDLFNGNKSETYAKVEDWLVKDLLLWKDGEIPNNYTRFSPHDCQKAIIYTHEMPFTITAAGTYGKYLKPNAEGSVFRESSKANLNTKHGFQFQRLFKLWGIRLVFGGHKHTCSISMPIYDAPGDYDPRTSGDNYDSTKHTPEYLMNDLSGADTFNPIIQVVKDDNHEEWGVDGKIRTALESFGQSNWGRGHIFNSTNTNVDVHLTNSTQTIPANSVIESNVQKPLCRYEIVDSISAPTYVMCQATGYKNISNSDTSDGTIHCQWQRALVQGQSLNTETWVGDNLKDTQREAQLYPFYTRFHVTNDHIDVSLNQITGMYNPSSKANYWNINRDMPNGHEAKMNDLYRRTWKSCTISLQ